MNAYRGPACRPAIGGRPIVPDIGFTRWLPARRRFDYRRSFHHLIDIDVPKDNERAGFNADLLRYAGEDATSFGQVSNDDAVTRFASSNEEFVLLSLTVSGSIELTTREGASRVVTPGVRPRPRRRHPPSRNQIERARARYHDGHRRDARRRMPPPERRHHRHPGLPHDADRKGERAAFAGRGGQGGERACAGVAGHDPFASSRFIWRIATLSRKGSRRPSAVRACISMPGSIRNSSPAPRALPASTWRKARPGWSIWS